MSLGRFECIITSIEFRNYKAFKSYLLALQNTNVLVGVNNSGTSTLLSSIRVLDTALKGARSQRPEPLYGPTGDNFGYPLAEDSLPISLENVHTDYVDSDTTITFRLSNANRLQLHFPNDGGCILIPFPAAKPIRTVDAFRSAYRADIVIVHVLGPVEHRELLVQQETIICLTGFGGGLLEKESHMGNLGLAG